MPFQKGWHDISLWTSPYVSEEFFLPIEKIPSSLPGREQLVEKRIGITKALGLPLKKAQESFYAKVIQSLAIGSSGSSGDQNTVKGISGFQALESLSACQVGCQRPAQWTSHQDTRQKPNTEAKLFQSLFLSTRASLKSASFWEMWWLWWSGIFHSFGKFSHIKYF